MKVSSSVSHFLVFLNVIFAAIFFSVLGAKFILSRCEIDEDGECITFERSTSLAEEVAVLRLRLIDAQSAATNECVDSQISPDDWNDGNPEVLEGCWDLQYDWSMRYSESGIENNLVSWGFCLDAAGGEARQSLYFEDGLQCVGYPLYYEFVDEYGIMQLRLSDGQDVPCDLNGVYSADVVARDLLCRLDPSGEYAECRSRSADSQVWRDGILLRRRQ